MKKTNRLVLLSLLLFSLFIQTFPLNAEGKSNSEWLASVVPILQSYEVDASGLTWSISDATRFVLEKTDENMDNDRLIEVVDLISAEFLVLDIPNLETEISKVFADLDSLTADDIIISVVDVSEVTDKTSSAEAYKITINEEGIEIKGASENAVLHALRTIMQLTLTKGGMPHGVIVDYPEVQERRVHVDMGRKFFTKEWFFQHIRELSYLKMNALQMHFSENMGFRIESDVAPDIVSDEFLTKDEVREIIKEANKYGISIIPSFDTPGHTEHILKFYPQFGQLYNDGGRSTVALDITNPDAVQLVKDLLNEYLDLFEGSTDFHIGADEYMEFDRPPFTNKVQPLLNEYAVKTLGPGHNWKDAMATYINELAEIVHERGVKPRIWNDGVYYGEKNNGGGAPQKVETHKYIGIDFWSQMSWNRSIANLQVFIDKGHTDLYNINASFFYYVLRPTKPNDGRDQASFDYPNQDIRIFDVWTPGKFQENTIDDKHPSIKGASLAIWNDVPNLVTEDVITTGISKELRSLASKAWNTSSNAVTDIHGFRATYGLVGNAPAFEKGTNLPATSPFVELVNVNTEALETLIAKAELYDMDLLTMESKALFRRGVQEAKQLLYYVNITQEDVDTMHATLSSVIANIVQLGKKDNLQTVYNDATTIETKTLSREAVEKLYNALFTAESALDTEEVTQDFYDDAQAALENSIDNLATKADKTELKQTYFTARKIDVGKLNGDDRKSLIEVLSKVEKVLVTEVTDQQILNDMNTELSVIMETLE